MIEVGTITFRFLNFLPSRLIYISIQYFDSAFTIGSLVVFQISYDIPCKTTLSTVKPLCKHTIVTLAAGQTHTAVIDGRLQHVHVYL